MSRARRLLPIALAVVASSLVACGGDPKPQPAAPGTPENPLVAQPSDANENGSAPDRRVGEPSTSGPGAAGFDDLVEEQTARPRERFTPCNLVTRREARGLIGAPLEQPVEAPQGPTCLYETQTGKRMVSLAVQVADFGRIKPRIRRLEQVALGERAAYCGTYGQPMLYVPLDDGKVLSVSGACDLAQEFARKALSRL